MGNTLLLIFKETTRRFELGDSPLRVGRDPSSDILITDVAISRHQLTLLPRAEGVIVEMNPNSPYQMEKGGRSCMRAELGPGESFHIGPYKFELQVAAKLPVAKQDPLDADPAGAIDLNLAEGSRRIAPSWVATEPASAEPAAPAKQEGSQPPRPVFLRLGLPVAVLALGGYMAQDYLRPTSAPAASPSDAGRPLHLLSAVRPFAEQDATARARKARESYQIAVRLSESEARDLLTLYKIAGHLHRASQALGPGAANISDLAERYQQSRRELETAFADTWFEYKLAGRKGNPQRQFAALQSLRPLCKEDPHAFCADIELDYRRLREQLGQRE